MRARTVQELLDVLQQVEDKSRTLMVAGGSPFDGVEVVGFTGPGHVIFWDVEECRKARRKSQGVW